VTSKIVPDDQDFEAVRKHLGTNAEKYRLAQERKLRRLYETGQLPADMMKELEKIRGRKE
jgi:hypothetical protein